MSDNTYTSNRRLNSGASPVNAISFLIENTVKGMINTAIPVRVDTVTAGGSGDAAGYVSVTPLVCQRGADGNSLPPCSLPRLPYFRLQSGQCAVVIDPRPGDIGLAVFAQQDCSNVASGMTAPAQAGSFRCYDMADGFYIGGFLGETPDTFIELNTASKEITVKSPVKVTIDAPAIICDAPQTTMTGNLQVDGNITTSANITANGNLTTVGTMTAGGIVMNTHKHGGVQTGSGTTGGPQ